MFEALAKILAQFGLTGLVAFVVRYIRHVTRESFSVIGLLRSTISFFFVLAVVGFVLVDYPLMTPNLKLAFVAVSCYMSDDLLSGVASIGRMLGSDPVGLAGRVWRIVKGGKLD